MTRAEPFSSELYSGDEAGCGGVVRGAALALPCLLLRPVPNRSARSPENLAGARGWSSRCILCINHSPLLCACLGGRPYSGTWALEHSLHGDRLDDWGGAARAGTVNFIPMRVMLCTERRVPTGHACGTCASDFLWPPLSLLGERCGCRASPR